MKLATFEYDGKQTWGFVLLNEEDGKEWVYEPEKCEKAIRLITNGTNGYFKCLPTFMPEGNWPKTMKEFLEMGDEGMDILRRFETFVKHYIKQSDPYFISCCGHPVEDVHMRVPVPDSRLFLGLVQNSPSFFRANPPRTHVNILPQGHQRAMTSVVGHGETFIGHPGGNVELAIVIGKECYNVPIDEIYDYIAGYTIVYDAQIADYYPAFDKECNGEYAKLLEKYPDWFADATWSWIGKGADSHCICGPYIVTKEEVGNPYDLLVWTKTNGGKRDRSSTAGYMIGVERTAHFFSQFMTLHPGDVIHMGTVGTDGIAADVEMMPFGENGSIGAEIEYVGELSAHVYYPEELGDNRSEKQKQIPLVPAVQDCIDKGYTEIDSFDISNIQNVWTCYGNFKDVNETLGWTKADSPRLLCGPRGQITDSRDELLMSPRATDIEISAEMALVIKKITKGATQANAKDYILGFAPIVSVTDLSIKNQIIEPATPQENGIGLVYGRWGDGYNTIGEVKEVNIADLKGTLTVEGVGDIAVDFAEYSPSAERVLEYLTSHTTLLPGDVIMLGRTSKVVKLAKDQYKDGVNVKLSVNGFESIERKIKAR